jgi:hypothetical protein
VVTQPQSYVEYPKWLYHRRHGGRVFNSAKETRWRWLLGWREQPFPPKKPGAGSVVRDWLQEWGWLFSAVGGLIGFAAGVVTLVKDLF